MSNRKAGKEGLTCDSIACAFTSVLFGAWLRVRGEKVEDNVHTLIDILPKMTSVNKKIRLTFDRGYGTMQFVTKVVEKKFDISTIVTTVGSRPPFLTQSESDKYVADCGKKGESSSEI